MSIRHSTNTDLVAVMEWLKAEHYQAGDNTGFWNHRLMIERAHNDGKLLVAGEHKTDEVVAFQVSDAFGPSIFEVRPDKRGMGYGRELANYCIDQARQQDECVLRITCAPVSSVPFWKHIGFQLYSEFYGEKCPSEFGNHAFFKLDKKYNICPADKLSVSVDICFHTELEETLEQVHISEVRQTHSGIALPYRVISYCPSKIFLGDTCVTVLINGEKLYSGKTRYSEAQAIGVQNRCDGVFAIDELILPKNATGITLNGKCLEDK